MKLLIGKNRRLIILEAMVESLKTRIWCQDFEEDGIYGGECRLGDCGYHDFWSIISIQKARTDQNPQEAQRYLLPILGLNHDLKSGLWAIRSQ